MAKVVILTPFSHPSKCGIWSRAMADAETLRDNGYKVSIFSSNRLKGTNEKLPFYENYNGIDIYRFPVRFSLGGNSMFWFFYRRFLLINPDFVHSHGYRHPHSLFSLLIAKVLGKKVLLTTHAPFEKDKNRSFIMKAFDNLYDIFIGWWELKLYNKVIRISNWETKYLEALGKKNSIYIPNGISELFFSTQPRERSRDNFKITYIGRLDPVKRPEWTVEAAKKLPEFNFKIWGPLNGYEHFNYDSENLEIIQKKYELSEFMEELDNSHVYLLMSTKEGLPFTLLEAMSRGVIVITSATNGAKDVVSDGINGFIVNSIEELVEKVSYVYNNWDELAEVRKNSVETAKRYRGRDVGELLIKELKNLKI